MRVETHFRDNITMPNVKIEIWYVLVFGYVPRCFDSCHGVDSLLCDSNFSYSNSILAQLVSLLLAGREGAAQEAVGR